MDISIEKLRNALSKDDHEYINSKLETLKAEAIASLEPTIGIDSEGAKNVAKNSTLDILSDRYIVQGIAISANKCPESSKCCILACASKK